MRLIKHTSKSNPNRRTSKYRPKVRSRYNGQLYPLYKSIYILKYLLKETGFEWILKKSPHYFYRRFPPLKYKDLTKINTVRKESNVVCICFVFLSLVSTLPFPHLLHSYASLANYSFKALLAN